MSGKSDRLRQARELTYESMVEAVGAMNGVVYSTYAGHENGSREYSDVEAVQYARLFRVNLIWLLTGQGEPRPKGGNHPIVDLFEAIAPDRQPQAIEFLEYLGRPRA